jgi:hypothetical protein
MSLKKFTWAFSMGDHPTELSCIAATLASAREQIMAQVAKITAAHAEYETLRLRLRACIADDAARKALTDRIKAMNATLEIDAFIGSWTSEVWYFTEDAEVTDYKDEAACEKTLKALITTTEPVVKPFHPVSLRTCLDG